jgi:hypothetical protein
MVKRILRVGCETDPIDQLGCDQLLDERLDTEAGQQFGVEARADHGCRGQYTLGLRVQAVDARADCGLQRGRHADLGHVCLTYISAALPAQHSALGEISDEFLCEERVTADPRHNCFAEVADRRVRAEQLAEQRGGL